MTERALVCDTSPLLYLGRVGQIHLIPALFPQVYVPDTVFLELDAGRLLRPDTADPRRFEWACRVEVNDDMLARLPETRLGAGEKAVIAYALARGGLIVGLDDHQARTSAEALGLRVIGVIGVLLRAKRAGHLTAVSPTLRKLVGEGFRIGPELYHAALTLAGEG